MSDSNLSTSLGVLQLSTMALMRPYAVIGNLVACQSSNRYQRGIDIIHRDGSFVDTSPSQSPSEATALSWGAHSRILGMDISFYSPLSTLYFAAAFSPLDLADPDGLEDSVQCNHCNALPQTLALTMFQILLTMFQAIKRT